MEATIDSKEVSKFLGAIRRRGDRPPLRRIPVIGIKSVQLNCSKSGRPTKWKVLAARSKGGRGKDEKGRQKRAEGSHPRAAGKPLLDKGYSGGMASTVQADHLGMTNVKVATKHPMAAIHQYGTGTFGPKKARYWIGPVNKKALSFIASDGSRVSSRGHWHPGIPARPFIGWQVSDITKIQKLLLNHLGGMK